MKIKPFFILTLLLSSCGQNEVLLPFDGCNLVIPKSFNKNDDVEYSAKAISYYGKEDIVTKNIHYFKSAENEYQRLISNQEIEQVLTFKKGNLVFRGANNKNSKVVITDSPNFLFVYDGEHLLLTSNLFKKDIIEMTKYCFDEKDRKTFFGLTKA